MSCSIYEALSISKFTNATNRKTPGMQNQTIILTLALQLHTFSPLGFIHSNSVTYSQSKKTEVAYYAACFIFFKRAKKDNKLHCDAVTPFPLSLIHSNGGCVADKTFSNQFLGINNQPSRAFLRLQSI